VHRLDDPATEHDRRIQDALYVRCTERMLGLGFPSHSAISGAAVSLTARDI